MLINSNHVLTIDEEEMPELEHGGPELGSIHRHRNDRKFFCHFTGFLEGIAASGYIECSEIEPLIAECIEFVRSAGDEDALDIIEDFGADLLSYDLIDDIVSVRATEIDTECQKSMVNRFLGLCRGIACDGLITRKEAERIIKEVEGMRVPLSTPGVRQIYISAVDALEDDVLSQEEADSICDAIGMLVGDCYASTGITQTSGVANFEEYRVENLDNEFVDKVVVLSGTFKVSPRTQFEDDLREYGAIISRSVTRKTDFVVVGGQASRDWIEMNRGTKIIKAQELRLKTGKPEFVSESRVLDLMRR